MSFYLDPNEIELASNIFAKEIELIKLMEESDSASNEQAPAVGPSCKEETPASRGENTPASGSICVEATSAPRSDVAVTISSKNEEVPSLDFRRIEDFPTLCPKRTRTGRMSGLKKEVNPTPGPNKVAIPVPGLSYREVASGRRDYNMTAPVNEPRNYGEAAFRSNASNGVMAPVVDSQTIEPTPVLSNGVATPGSDPSDGEVPASSSPSGEEEHTEACPSRYVDVLVNGPRNYEEGSNFSNGEGAPVNGLGNRVVAPVVGSQNSEPFPRLSNGVATPRSNLSNGEVPASASPNSKEPEEAGPCSYVDVDALVNGSRRRSATPLPGMYKRPSSAPGPSRQAASPAPSNKALNSAPVLSNGTASPPPGISRKEEVPGSSNNIPSSVPGLSNKVSSSPGTSRKEEVPAPGPRNGFITSKVPNRGASTTAAGRCPNEVTSGPGPSNLASNPKPGPTHKGDACVLGPSQKEAAPVPDPGCKAADPMAGPNREAPELMADPNPEEPDPDPLPEPKFRRFVPVDPNNAADRRFIDDVGWGFNVRVVEENGVPVVSANGGYVVVLEGHKDTGCDEDEEEGAVDDEDNDEELEESEASEESEEAEESEDSEESDDASEESEAESEADSCYFSSDTEDRYNIVYLLAPPPAPRRIVGYYKCRCFYARR